MQADTVRARVHLDPALHQAPRLVAASSRRSTSEVCNEALRAALCEDEEDPAAIAERAGERTLDRA